ncbi:MAG TPA: transglutaminase domain-containing protein [Flavisolibacter sp.]
MKKWVFGLVMFFFALAGKSQQKANFSSIDWKVQSMEAPTPDSLAGLIKTNFTTPLEKVRAIYSWIATHIEYNTNIYKPWLASYHYSPDPLDTAAVWPSGDEMVARKVMRKRSAVCDGYARLFKVLCDYAGVEAQIVQGYARSAGTNKFRTNHTWNAVRIDSAWHLIDVTWASGYLNFGNDYVQKQNDYYFFTPPEQFINDHYPEELKWTLLPNPPMVAEFKRMPFQSKNFNRYGFDSFFPNTGIIEAAVGDTIRLKLQLKDVERAKTTGNDPFTDTTTFTFWPASSFLKPEAEKKNLIFYTFIVPPTSGWLHLLYNDDVVMHYRIQVSAKSTSLVSK